MRGKRGATILNVGISIAVILIIFTTVTFTGMDALKSKKLDNLYNDIRILKEKVDLYYLKYGKIPVVEEYTEPVSYMGTALNPNDGGKYYKLNVNAFKNVTLNTDINSSSFFIINEQTHTIYYPMGVLYKGVPYYTVPEKYAGGGFDKTIVPTVVSEGDRTAPIPAGFVASSVDGENTIAGGLVIYETDEPVTSQNHTTALTTYNQYVWIPVDDINDMVMCSECGGGVRNLEYDELGQTLSCTTANHTGTQKLVGKLYSAEVQQYPITNDEGTQTGVIMEYNMDFTQSNQAYNTTSAHEPGVTEADSNEANYHGLGSAEAFLSKMQTDFDDMAKSVAKYKGFYISRYEINEDGGSKKGMAPMTEIIATNWYGFYNTLNKIAESTTSQMIWGSQYDQVMKFIGDEAEIGHSDWSFSNEPAAVSGNNPDDEMMNICDLEGNLGEWTAQACGYMEMYGTDALRAIRGGAFQFLAYGNQYVPASLQTSYVVIPQPMPFATISSRATLFINL